MAKSREIPAPNNDSETEESETEVSESPEPEPVKKAAKIQKPADSSSEESGSESESESDSDSDTKQQLPPTPAPAAKDVTASPTTRSKRSSTPLSPKSSKKSKSGMFERVFATDDEIVLLEELLKRQPSPQMDDLYESLKNKISVSVTKAQVVNKIRSIRKKFFSKNKNKKGSKNVVEDEHQRIVNQLSQQIWGNEEEGPKSVAPKSKIALRFEDSMAKDEKKKKDGSFFPTGEGWVFGEGTGMLPEEARNQLETNWYKIRKEEARLCMEKHELAFNHAKMVYEAISSKYP